MREVIRYVGLILILFFVFLMSIHLYGDDALRSHDSGYEKMQLQQQKEEFVADGVIVENDQQNIITNDKEIASDDNTLSVFTIDVIQ